MVPTIYSPVEVTHLKRSCQNTVRKLTHHCRIKEDKNSRSQEACWSQNNDIINHAQDGNNRSSSQQAANGSCLEHPLSVVGAQVDELRDTKSSEWTLRGRRHCLRRKRKDRTGTQGKEEAQVGSFLSALKPTPLAHLTHGLLLNVLQLKDLLKRHGQDGPPQADPSSVIQCPRQRKRPRTHDFCQEEAQD